MDSQPQWWVDHCLLFSYIYIYMKITDNDPPTIVYLPEHNRS